MASNAGPLRASRGFSEAEAAGYLIDTPAQTFYIACD